MKKIITLFACINCLVCNAQDFEWAVSYGGSFADWFADMVVDNNGDLITAGRFDGPLDIDPGPNSTVVDGYSFLQKFDPNGQFIWGYSFGNDNKIYSSSIAVDDQNNIYMTGSFFDTVDFDPGPGIHLIPNQGNYRAFVLKVDAGGNFLWAKEIPNIGLSGTNSGYKLHLDVNNNILLSGTFRGTIDLNPDAGIDSVNSIGQSSSTFILKWTSDGTYLAGGAVGNRGAWYIGYGGFTVKPSGKVLLVGEFIDTADFDPGIGVHSVISTNPNGESFLLELDQNLEFLAVTPFASTSTWGGPSGIVSGANGSTYIAGRFQGTADFDLSAATYNLSSLAGDTYLLKLNWLGDFEWVKHFIGSQVYNSDITTDNQGHVYLCGTFRDSVDLDTASTLITTGFGQSYANAYVVKFDESGTALWSEFITGDGFVYSTSLAVSNSLELYVGGTYRDTVDLDPTAGTAYFSSPMVVDTGDVFIQKLSNLPTGEAPADKTEVCDCGTVMFPNPTDRMLTIVIDEKFDNGVLRLLSVDGRILQTREKIARGKLFLDLADYPAGLYFLQLEGTAEMRSCKVLKR